MLPDFSHFTHFPRNRCKFLSNVWHLITASGKIRECRLEDSWEGMEVEFPLKLKVIQKSRGLTNDDGGILGLSIPRHDKVDDV